MAAQNDAPERASPVVALRAKEIDFTFNAPRDLWPIVVLIVFAIALLVLMVRGGNVEAKAHPPTIGESRVRVQTP